MNLTDKVLAAGVIGAGGAGFPTHIKLNAKADYVLLNGAECEPLLRVDQQLMYDYPKEIINGLELVREKVEAKVAYIGIKAKHRKVIEALTDSIKSLGLNSTVCVKEMEDVYPAGDEQMLVYELTGRTVPEMGIPLHVGCVVINSETALNVYKAFDGSPVTHTYVTVTGDVPRPITTSVPVGMSILEVLKLSGRTSFEGYRVIDGGPMMGPVLEDLNGYVTKKSKGFIVLKENHPLILKKTATMQQKRRVNRSACEQCRLCTDLCPRYLVGHSIKPHQIMNASNYHVMDYSNLVRAQLCCQCNLCELFACKSGLYPQSNNTFYKEELYKQNIKYKPEPRDYSPNPIREHRLLPSKRLVARLGLKSYDVDAPLVSVDANPDRVSISLKQHIGAPSVPSVKVGDMVYIGSLIATDKEGALSARVHSSIDGMVERVEHDYIVVRGANHG